MVESRLVRAVYQDGTLQLLEPVGLPEGMEVWVELRVAPWSDTEVTRLQRVIQSVFSYPTNPQPPETLACLVGLVAVGGDALADSEALYDADWN